jgi:hypothetical protein
MNPKLEELLEELDNSNQQLGEHSILSKINSVTREDESLEAKSEKIAFSFYENYENNDPDWGSYYGPMAVWTGEDGEVYESPNLSLVSEEMLDYWKARAEKTNNHLMKARYTGLIWDLTQPVLHRSPNYQIAIAYVNALIMICERDLCEYPSGSIQKITRAFWVARALNNEPLIEACINTAILLEDRIAVDDKPGLWGFCFDLFVLGKEETLTTPQKDKLISGLEARLSRVSLNDSPWVCESAGIPLATYYRSINQIEDVKRIVEVVGSSFETVHEGQAAILTSSLYRHVHDIYIRFNLKEKAESVSRKIAEIGPDVAEDMHSFSHSMEIPTERLDAYLGAIADGGIEKAIKRIVAQFIPKKGQVEQQVLDLAKDYPLSFLFSTTLQDHRGRPVATIGGIEDDLEGNMIHQLSQNMGIESFFLHHCFIKVIEQYEVGVADLLEIILQSPIFEESKKELIERGVSAFLEGDYVTAIHILVPQTEAAFRNLVEFMGSATLRKNRQGGLQLRTFGDLLKDDAIEKCFGEDAAFYFRILLTDQRGWNLRNNVCHGISPTSAFNYSTADRIIHVMLCLAQVRENNAQS